MDFRYFDLGAGGELHGADGTVARLILDDLWVHGSTDGEIFTLIANGAGEGSLMIPFKGKMPDQDLWHVVNYLRSLGPEGAAR